MRFTSWAFVIFSLLTNVVGLQLVGRDAIPDDTCASLNNDLSILGIVFGKLNTCLCISQVPAFLTTNLVALAAVKVFGKPAPASNYPDSVTPMCITGNVCYFTCNNGFDAVPTVNPTTCSCVAPKIICNGQCIDGPICSSILPRRREARGQCRRGLIACAIPGRNMRFWECVDTQNDLESCGGCVYSTGGLESESPAGQDCTALRGVSNVACVKGACAVRRCMPGYDLAREGHGLLGATCVPSAERENKILAVQQYGNRF
ncbi:hypothetical protein C8J57DRAFT_1508131 [Mycena rebaudengoi]|nr:hypothetical protein C8J57DRAFT_1508131 [Mycena rebaudengoi]